MRKIKYKKLMYFGFFICGSLLLVLATYSFSKDFIRNYKLDKEIAALETEMNNLKQNNVKLTDLIRYFDSESYIEEKARLELGLMKPGESLVLVPKKIADENSDINKSVAMIIENSPNLKKWWRYFFQNN